MNRLIVLASMLLLVSAIMVVSGAASGGAELPFPISPARSEGIALISQGCPTFLWGGIEGARAFELVVYRVSEREAETPQEDAKAGPLESGPSPGCSRWPGSNGQARRTRRPC
jgi:hypothetical protein